eukprot:CAMPEP_0184305954 /NCGR_PEP_ID=MMETSP1049-20130417/15078_1 /TAXON_ID=77928 /ORGANISM="Proteomonas sulcata, Strain CCMP704" /LENGTH=116 /DNA_ID=CAMNT_0026618113 /DNA_START=235 /DNA_END=585 /DNA_ORIENTATION=-
MFYHAMHLLSHPSAGQIGFEGLKGAQVCALAGRGDAGVVCQCAARSNSCPEPDVVGTTKGLHVPLPPLARPAAAKAFLKAHPNSAYLHVRPSSKGQDPIQCGTMSSLVSASLPGCP